MERFDVFPLYSPELRKMKTIRVFVPDREGIEARRLPVLYMHDGQNLFEDRTASFGVSWNIRETCREINHEGGTARIVVGVDSEPEDRWNEYSPYPCDAFARNVKAKKEPEGGNADAYVTFLVQTLKPWIDDHYPTEPNQTALAGSSMGGLVSVFAAIKHPTIFPQIGAFSPAWWFHTTASMEMLENAEFLTPVRIYQDMGTAETSHANLADFPKIYLEGARKAASILEGKDHLELLYLEFEGAVHNEAAWASRFGDFLHWLQ
jgi:predicted alpha/beta superfamily hydrolase